MSFKVVIPARYASTRLPGKPLLEIAGQPMLRHVYARGLESGADEVVIATDDPRIRDCAEGFGAPCLLTSEAHRSGTDRITEVAERLGWADDQIVVNVQGDEPELPPALIRQVAADLAGHPEAVVATLCTPIGGRSQVFDPNAVKVVRDAAGFALYFSRAPIPWQRDGFGDATAGLPADFHWHRHIGLYAYRVGYLKGFVRLAPAPLEQLESLEQLRVQWYGGRIFVGLAGEAPAQGVDTPEDLERVRQGWPEGR
jgi:3-deoxy-manno-octulosonate cytidylyltransferase (CMP-KDO synthetase)